MKPAALGKGSGRVSNAEPQVPQGSRNRSHGLAERLGNPGAFGKEKQVDIRIREQLLPSITADGHQAEITGPGWVWGEQVPVELHDDFVHQSGTLPRRGEAVARGLERVPDPSGFAGVEFGKGRRRSTRRHVGSRRRASLCGKSRLRPVRARSQACRNQTQATPNWE